MIWCSRKDVPLFTEYAQEWLNGYVKALKKQSTYERYSEILEHYIYPAFGYTEVDQVTRGDIRRLFLNLHKSGKSLSMLELVRDVASGPFRFAEEDGIIPVNPVRGVLRKLGLKRDKISSGNPLNREEVRRFLTTCQESFTDYHPFFLVAFRTGMRMGELLALHWDDVIWERKVIRVERTFRRGKIGKPKNGKVRYTDMSGQVVRVLKKLHKRRKDDEQIIFPRKGGYIPQNSVRRIFKKILREAGLKDIRFHDIRHTFASILASEGESMFYLKEQLGHWSVQMTDEIYAHLLPSGKNKAVNRLDE